MSNSKFPPPEEIIQAAAQVGWGKVLGDLSPNLREAIDTFKGGGKVIHIDCPVHGGKKDFRLYNDFLTTGGGVCSCGNNPGGVKLLAWANNISGKEAFKSIAEYLNDKIGRVEITNARPVQPREKKSVFNADAKKRIDSVLSLCNPSSHEKSAPLKRYLRRRGITLQNIPDALLWNPRLTYVEPGDDDKWIRSYHPGMVAEIRNVKGEVISLHRTYLTWNGAKADVNEPKKLMKSVYGSISGAAIRLFAAKDVLGVCEGIETGLAVHQVTGMPVWPCIATAGLTNVVIPESIKTVYIWADLDQNSAGYVAAKALMEKLVEKDKNVFICMPPGPIPEGKKGRDWLDVLNEDGVKGFPSYAFLSQNKTAATG